MRYLICLSFQAISLATAFAQPTSEWKQTIPHFSHYVHEPSVTRSKDSKGNESVEVWTLKNVDPPGTASNGKKFQSIKSLHTIDCSSRISESKLTGYSEQDGRGAVVAGPMRVPLENIEPDSLADGLWNAYCKKWWQRFR